MSHSPPFNYTDGVPVKISEKYKQPPEIHIPKKLSQNLSKIKVPNVAFEDYNFDLERKIISKTTEWINWRLKEKTERQQRIQQRELLRQKRLEEEQKAKLNQVSYPSADEFSEDDEDLDDEASKHSEKLMKNDNQVCIPNEKVFSPNFNTILMPTQAAVNQTDKKSHRRYASNSSNKIDFSFFESDASPFDNLEIKSMNEMEELAKVLQSTVVESQESDDNALERNNSSESEPSSEHQKNININNNNSIDASKSQNSSESQVAVQNNPYSVHNYNPQQLYNNYYYGTATQPYYNSTQQRFATAEPHQFSSPYVANQQILPNNCYYTQNYAANHMNYAHSLHMSSNNNNMACENINNDKTEVENKSRSVPDIIKELNDELNNSARRRHISQSNQKNVVEEDEPKAVSNVDEQLNKLPVTSQNLAKQICQMGFNQGMVIRALIRLGDNDKKIVEHLISLNEILQMGFEEELVSQALIKFDNNKDQALDYLIS